MNIPEISPYYPPFMNQSKPQAPLVTSPFLQKREVEYVTGREGAEAFQLAPNSSALLLDKELNVLWVIATDQNGSKSVVKGYNIGEEYTPPKPVTLDDLMAQMQSLNERLNKMEEEKQNGQSDSKPAVNSKPYESGNAESRGSSSSHAVREPDGSTCRTK